MIYVIEQLALWLALTAGFAALAGWAFAVERAGLGEQALRRQRETLLADLTRFSIGENHGDGVESEREADAMRRLLEIRDGRIAELEHMVEAARARAADAASRVVELERQKGHERASVLDVEASSVDEQAELRNWRLRYFEQRVRYLEGLARAPSPEPEWRAREAEARAAHLEQEVRDLKAPAQDEAPPFAANSEVDMLLRWRLLYLERRAGHLQAQVPARDVDADRWKWRARYLEARVRHFERETPAAVVAVAPANADAPAPPIAARTDAAKPPMLPAARNGGPDDFTLIEDVNAMQQATLYALGVFHFEQIAAWSPGHVAWVDQYLRLRGRIDEEEWVEQARDLASGGVAASRRMLETEDA